MREVLSLFVFFFVAVEREARGTTFETSAEPFLIWVVLRSRRQAIAVFVLILRGARACAKEEDRGEW